MCTFTQPPLIYLCACAWLIASLEQNTHIRMHMLAHTPAQPRLNDITLFNMISQVSRFLSFSGWCLTADQMYDFHLSPALVLLLFFLSS